jgi:hypothetical protein
MSTGLDLYRGRRRARQRLPLGGSVAFRSPSMA